MQYVDLVLSPLLVILSVGSMAVGTARVVRQRTVDGVSVYAIMLGMMNNLGWITYGAIHNDSIQFMNNIPAAIGALMVMGIAWKTGVINKRRIPAMALAVFVVGMLSSVSLFGAIALGAILNVLTFVNRMPQLVSSWKVPYGEGLSVSGVAMAVAASAGWAFYGLIHGQAAVLVSGSYGLITWGFILLRAVQGKRLIAGLAVEAEQVDTREAALQVA